MDKLIYNSSPQVVKTIHSDEMVSFKRENGNSKLYDEIIVKAKVDTISKAINYAVTKYQDKECLGTRQILGIHLNFENISKFQKHFKNGRFLLLH